MPNTDIATRALVVTLRAVGNKETSEIAEITGLQARTITNIFNRACDAGFDPTARPLILKDDWLRDKPRSGRPTKQVAETQEKLQSLVRHDRYGRERTCTDFSASLASHGIDISASTVFRILKKAGFRKTKPTRKPGLTIRMRKERLQWCLDRKDWTLEDWKKVIWSDETSVILLHRRGGYRIWRTSEEKLQKSCIRERWKGASEFMFWGSFSYDKKGPCHCWLPETAAEKRHSEAVIAALNKDLEPQLQREWELANGLSRLNLRQKTPGRKPQWQFNQKTGKLARSPRGGIDWYRYQTKILTPKLIPFAQECGPNSLVQEDKAPSHIHPIQQQVYDLHQVQRLLWCGNSPDLNAIEPAWPWIKRATTKKGAPSSRLEAIKRWEEAWKDLPQDRIRGWIERIPRHIQEIIRLEGGNEYQEGRRAPQ